MYIFLTITCLALLYLQYRAICPLIDNEQWSEYVLVKPGKRTFTKTTSGPEPLLVNPKKIPKIIVQTNEKERVPIGMAKATDTLLKANPGYSYVYFSDDRARSYIATHYPREVLVAYDTLLPGAYKADLFRYCFLNTNGGVYIDMGMVALPGQSSNLDDIINDDDMFVSPEDNGTGRIYNAFMASTPNNPILSTAIQMIVDNVNNRRYGKDSLSITGPGLLADAFEHVTNETPRIGLSIDGEKGRIRIVEFYKYLPCESGTIKNNDRIFLFTKYPGYRKDQQWYNTNPHYSSLWNARRVYD